MKIVSKPVDAVAVFRGAGRPLPFKFRYIDSNGESCEIKVNQILCIEERRVAGNKSIVYECQSLFGSLEKRYQLKYLVDACRWELYKI